MAELTRAEFEAAKKRYREMREKAPHAASARYDAEANRIVVELTNGASFSFAPQLLQGMDAGTPEQFAEVEVIGAGYGLHWETLDADFTVPGLLQGIFGTTKWMAHRAGKTSSPAKAKAARANGAKGGRPKKQAA